VSRNVLIVSLAAASIAAGCSGRPVGSFDQAASFGAATASNNITQAAYAYSDRRLVAYADKFRAETNDSVNFEFDSAALDAGARQTLDSQADWLLANPSVRMRIYGYTDAVGAPGYNDRLGLRRARAVVRYLSSKGVASNRLDAVESFGESELLVPTEERERRNRRAVTTVAGFAQGYVGDGLDGKRALLGYKEYVDDRTETVTIEETGG
jgi:peptidoglycan-associated lipoprotein